MSLGCNFISIINTNSSKAGRFDSPYFLYRDIIPLEGSIISILDRKSLWQFNSDGRPKYAFSTFVPCLFTHLANDRSSNLHIFCEICLHSCGSKWNHGDCGT